MAANPILSSSVYTQENALEYCALRDLEQVAALAPQWDKLLEQSQCNRAFSSSGWFLAWCRHHPGVKPFVLIARRDAELAALLPLALKEDRALDFPSPMCDYNDMVANTSDLAAQDGLLAYAASHVAGKQIAFSNLRPDSNCVQTIYRMAGSSGLRANYQPDKNCFYIQLSGTLDGYLATRSHIFRKGLGRVQRNAQRNDLEVHRLTPALISPQEIAELFLSLNLSRFGSRSGFAAKSVQEFIRELLPSLFITGTMTAFVLMNGSRIVAIDLCMRGWNSLCTWNGGFLPEAARWSPGKLLFAAGIEHAVALGLQEYDLLRGTHAYKTSWATHSRTIGNLELNRQSCTDALANHEAKSPHCL